MNNRNLSVIFILSIILTISNCFQPGDDIVVYYLEAPLFFSKFGTLLANINAFHSGLGFRSMNSPESYTVDFVGVPGVLESILPTGIENGEIIWNSAGQVNVKDFIDNTGYWSSEMEIMKIDYEMFDIFLCWAKNYNQTYDYYQLFDVYNSVTNQSEFKSTVCNDFVWKGVDALYNLGGLYTSTEIEAKRDLVTIYTQDEIVIVDNGATNLEVIQFYSAMLNVSVPKNQTVSGLINELDQLFKGVFYLYCDGVYYNITLDTPPLSFSYSVVPLASGERSVTGLNFIDGCIVVDDENNGNDGIGGGWIFLIILLSVSFIYIVGGCLINKFKNNKSGLDLFPNRESWSSLGGLVGDGYNSIKSKITGNSTSGYSNI